MIALRLLGLLWSSPGIAVLWVCYVLPMWLLRQLRYAGSPRFGVAAFVVSPDAWGWYREAWAQWGGMGAHAVVLARDEAALWQTLRHELRHTDQALVLGVLYGPLYLFGLLCWGYYDSPLERHARLRG